MRTCHWSAFVRSGMNRVAESCVEAEKKLGIDAILMNVQESPDWEQAYDADVHITHTHFPDKVRRRVTKPLRLAWVGHGTPEHVFQHAVEDGATGAYGHGDSFMLMQYWLQHADARITFWERHQAIYKTMVDRGTAVHLIPMGVDLEFWASGASRGKYAGTPSVWTGENPHWIKHPLDLFLMWPWIYPQLDGASLHACYVPRDQHRWVAPLLNRNGASYGMHWTPITWAHEDLRNVFKSIDYFIGLVRYGDFNRLCLEANAAGARTISYAGNPYSDYWVPEGDQRRVAAELVPILKGDVPPRAKASPPDFLDMAKAMIAIYEEILGPKPGRHRVFLPDVPTLAPTTTGPATTTTLQGPTTWHSLRSLTGPLSEEGSVALLPDQAVHPS